MKEPSKREILNAVRQLAVLVRLGYPLAEGLKNMGGEASPWLTQLAENMEQGDDLSSALARQPRLFSPLFRGLVEAAAANPQPDRVLEELSHWLERGESLQGKVSVVLLYPMLLLALLAAFLTFAILVVIPSAIVPLRVDAGGWEIPPWLALLPLMVLLPLVVSLLKGQPWAPLLWFFPEIRDLRRLASQSLWARALGALLAAGVDVVGALDQANAIVTDSVLRQQLLQASSEARKGMPLEGALAQCSRLEAHLIWSLQGEDIAARVLEAADALDREIELRSEQQLRLMGPRALLFVAILTTLAIVGFWWPFYELTGSIQ